MSKEREQESSFPEWLAGWSRRPRGMWPYVLLFLAWSLLITFRYLFFGTDSLVHLHDNGDTTVSNLLAHLYADAGSTTSGWIHLRLCGVD